MAAQAEVPTLLADGGKETREHAAVTNRFMDRAFRTRIGMRLLVEHQVRMRDSTPGFVGAVCTNLKPAEVVARCAGIVRSLAANSVFRRAPEVVVLGNKTGTFSFVPFHLEYMFGAGLFLRRGLMPVRSLTETLKNSVKATLLHNNNRMGLNVSFWGTRACPQILPQCCRTLP
jgi:hypothetical protein